MKQKLGKWILISTPVIFLLYFFIDSYIYNLPTIVFNLILLYIAGGLLLIAPKEK
jgi:hypothetical protein